MKAKISRHILICGALVFAAATVLASTDSVQIEFRCKIVPLSVNQDAQLQSWMVEMKRTTGGILRVAKALDGQTVRFKNLVPGIYSACLVGNFNRIHCESVDLNPPADSKSYRVSMHLKTPRSVLNQDDLHKINGGQLTVSQEAHNELDLATLAEFRGEDQEAIHHLRAAVEIDPQYSDALNNLGAYFHRARDYEKAIECFAKVTQLDPDFYGGWANLSGSLIAVSRFKEALAASTRAYLLRPHEPLVLGHYAKSLYYLHDYSQARKYFEELADLDPQNAAYPQMFLAQIAIVDGDLAQARQLIARFMQMHPYAPETIRYKELLKALNSAEIIKSAGADPRPQLKVR